MFSPFEASQIVFFNHWFFTVVFSLDSSILARTINLLLSYLLGDNFSSFFHNLTTSIFNNEYCCFFFFGFVTFFFISKVNNFNSYSYSFYYSALMYIYGLLANLLISYLGIERMFLFPFFFYLFLFLIFFNLYGLIPDALAITSHLSITLSISFILWFTTLLNAFRYRNGTFYGDFILVGIPSYLVPLLMIVEILSFLIRLFSPALRLFANIVAGHILIHVFITVLNMLALSYLCSISCISIVSSILISLFIVVLLCFEICIALLQAYILLLIAILYTRDVFALTH